MENMKIAGEEIGGAVDFPFLFRFIFYFIFPSSFPFGRSYGILDYARTTYMCMRAYKVMPIVYIY